MTATNWPVLARLAEPIKNQNEVQLDELGTGLSEGRISPDENFKNEKRLTKDRALTDSVFKENNLTTTLGELVMKNTSGINTKIDLIEIKRFGGNAKIIPLICVLLTLIACGSTPVSESRYASVHKQIKKAELVNAGEVAGSELYEAQKKFEDARKADKNGNRKQALRLLKEAELHAQLAESKTMTAQAQKMLDEINLGLKTLQHELIQ